MLHSLTQPSLVVSFSQVVECYSLIQEDSKLQCRSMLFSHHNVARFDHKRKPWTTANVNTFPKICNIFANRRIVKDLLEDFKKVNIFVRGNVPYSHNAKSKRSACKSGVLQLKSLHTFLGNFELQKKRQLIIFDPTVYQLNTNVPWPPITVHAALRSCIVSFPPI